MLGMANSLDLLTRAETLAAAARYDVCAPPGPSSTGRLERFLYPAAVSGGRRVNLLKILLTNQCGNDCGYCANRLEGARRPLAFGPDELARLFMSLRRQGRASGLFLSSGIGGDADRTMEKMIATAEILRGRYEFKGYIHLKILPGSSEHLAEAACRLASRASINLEAPNPARLAALACDKSFHEQIMARVAQLSRLQEGGLLPDGHTTQFVVGAAGESDREILSALSGLYRDFGLRRAYFSAFSPVPGTPLGGLPAESPWRQHRLYQADFLHRLYGFQLEELALDGEGRLSLGRDPKQAWAEGHPEFFPVDVDRATRGELLRVPGIGPVSADRIIEARRECRLKELGQLKALKVLAGRAAPFILLDGKRPPREERRARQAPEQLLLSDKEQG
ncbi:MAG: radical SAM protein [Candidatus Geothermincolia bacterium]